MKHIEQAIEILRLTKDGQDLALPHLAVVQAAVNGYLTEQGEVVFSELYNKVSAGEYNQHEEHLCGVPNLIRDHEGYVYWRGRRVEHFSHMDYESMREAALRLAERCQALEAKGFPVDGRTVMSDMLLDAPADTPWLEVLLRYYAFFTKDEEVCIILSRYETDNSVALVKTDGVVHGRVYGNNFEAYHATAARGYEPAGTNLSYVQIVELLERSKLTPEEIRAAVA